jgi:hypothetical protein
MTVSTHNLIVDLSLLTEHLAKDLIVDHQRLTLLPGESGTFTVCAPSEDLALALIESAAGLLASQNSLQ